MSPAASASAMTALVASRTSAAARRGHAVPTLPTAIDAYQHWTADHPPSASGQLGGSGMITVNQQVIIGDRHPVPAMRYWDSLSLVFALILWV
jgi:hypothetical protein